MPVDPPRRWVALLRGVNVGGRTTVPMAGLRAAYEGAGCADVRTYIQSGNVVLTSDLAAGELRAMLESVTRERLGVAAEVMVRTGAEMASVVQRCPYPDAARGHVHVVFLHEPADPAPLEDIELPPEELAVSGREVYLHLPGGMGRSRLAAEVLRRLGTPATVRNWRTVTRLCEMSTAG